MILISNVCIEEKYINYIDNFMITLNYLFLRYIKTTMVHFEDLREVASKYLTQAATYLQSKYEIISSYPPVAFVGSLVKKASVLTFKVIANPDVLGR